MKIINHTAFLKKQNGAALMVSLVLIFMLTILGISAMSEATLESQLASNSAHKEITFQSAESASDIVMAIDDSSQAMAVESFICKEDALFNMDELSEPDVQNTTVTVGYKGEALPIGWSLGGPVGGRRFMVTGESSLPGASTSTRISQGIVAIGAVEQGVDC